MQCVALARNAFNETQWCLEISFHYNNWQLKLMICESACCSLNDMVIVIFHWKNRITLLLFSYSVVTLRYDLNQSRISPSHNFHRWHRLLYSGMSSIENTLYLSHTPCHRRVWIPKETVINFQERIFKVPKSLLLEKFGDILKCKETDLYKVYCKKRTLKVKACMTKIR